MAIPLYLIFITMAIRAYIDYKKYMVIKRAEKKQIDLEEFHAMNVIDNDDSVAE